MVCDPTNPDTELDKLISSSISLVEKMGQQRTSSEEDLSHEAIHKIQVSDGAICIYCLEETLPLPDDEVHRVFEELEILVRGNDLEKALGKEIKPEILHFCKILDGSTLPESMLHYVDRVKCLLESTSGLSSDRTEYSLVVEVYERVRAIVEQLKRGSADASITLQIALLENWLAEELPKKVTAEKILNGFNLQLQWKMKDWKNLQESFRWL